MLIGVLLIGIGVSALFTAKKLVIHEHAHEHVHAHHTLEQSHRHSHLHLHVGKAVHPHEPSTEKHAHAPMWIGLLHGIAGTGHLFGLVPALGLAPMDATAYLVAYVIASIATMIIFIMCLDVVITRAGKALMPRLIRITAYGAIFTGIFWLYSFGATEMKMLSLGS